MRLYVECLNCKNRDGDLEVVEEAIDYHRRSGDELLMFNLERGRDFVVYDICPDCNEAAEGRWEEDGWTLEADGWTAPEGWTPPEEPPF